MSGEETSITAKWALRPVAGVTQQLETMPSMTSSRFTLQEMSLPLLCLREPLHTRSAGNLAERVLKPFVAPHCKLEHPWFSSMFLRPEYLLQAKSSSSSCCTSWPVIRIRSKNKLRLSLRSSSIFHDRLFECIDSSNGCLLESLCCVLSLQHRRSIRSE